MSARLAVIGWLFGVTSGAAMAQQPVTPTFEVATVKPVKAPDGQNRISIQPGGRLTFGNITLKQLISTSYQRTGFDNREIPPLRDEWNFLRVCKRRVNLRLVSRFITTRCCGNCFLNFRLNKRPHRWRCIRRLNHNTRFVIKI